MRIILQNLKTSIEKGPQAAVDAARHELKLPKNDIFGIGLFKTSVDARKGQVSFVSSVWADISANGLERLKKRGKPRFVMMEDESMTIEFGGETLAHRPVVIGLGPGGMFAALLLARNGYRPLVIERGGSVDERTKDVESFWNGKPLNTESNVQFGEGGAGTFSDGKLTTRINDPLCRFVLEEFVKHGAPEDILVRAKPHVGTDNLRNVVKSIREEIISLGGEVRFYTKAEAFETKSGAIESIRANGDTIPAEAVIAAIGHSARDTFDAISVCGASLAPKPFSVGVRIEHLQSDIDKSLYGNLAGHKNLPKGEYQLSHRNEFGRAAYTFCMCPGGQVVAAASQEGGVVTNGMSSYARDLPNANSALAVSVSPDDFGSSWKDAIAFQRKIESAAFKAGGCGYKAPAMTVGAFLGTSSSDSSKVEPSYSLGVVDKDIREVLPPVVTQMMFDALPILGRKLRGFDSPDAVLTAAETRTSSPVRIIRGENGCALGVDGLYPCGEGAGYAGGITSAAVDGLRCAMALMKRFARPLGE